jgi:hypothetical protein
MFDVLYLCTGSMQNQSHIMKYVVERITSIEKSNDLSKWL